MKNHRHWQIKDSCGETVVAVTGVAWSGVYTDGSLGWLAPHFVSYTGPDSLSQEQRKVLNPKNESHYPSDFYRVKVTITPLKNKRGKFIVRRNPRKARRP